MAYIRRLHGRYQTAIISNALPGLRTLLTGKYPIADAFDVIVGSGDERVMKPDPAIYHLALERLSCAPAAAIFIDDAPRNVEGARAVGMHAIQYVPGLDLPGALAAYGVTFITRLPRCYLSFPRFVPSRLPVAFAFHRKARRHEGDLSSIWVNPAMTSAGARMVA